MSKPWKIEESTTQKIVVRWRRTGKFTIVRDEDNNWLTAQILGSEEIALLPETFLSIPDVAKILGWE